MIKHGWSEHLFDPSLCIQNHHLGHVDEESFESWVIVDRCRVDAGVLAEKVQEGCCVGDPVCTQRHVVWLALEA